MATTKNRINMTVDKDVEKALIFSARRGGVSVAGKAMELIRRALELEEDLTLASIAGKRLSQKNIKWLSHKATWKLNTTQKS